MPIERRVEHGREEIKRGFLCGDYQRCGMRSADVHGFDILGPRGCWTRKCAIIGSGTRSPTKSRRSEAWRDAVRLADLCLHPRIWCDLPSLRRCRCQGSDRAIGRANGRIHRHQRTSWPQLYFKLGTAVSRCRQEQRHLLIERCATDVSGLRKIDAGRDQRQESFPAGGAADAGDEPVSLKGGESGARRRARWPSSAEE
jgi:hypothetical protein